MYQLLLRATELYIPYWTECILQIRINRRYLIIPQEIVFSLCVSMPGICLAYRYRPIWGSIIKYLKLRKIRPKRNYSPVWIYVKQPCKIKCYLLFFSLNLHYVKEWLNKGRVVYNSDFVNIDWLGNINVSYMMDVYIVIWLKCDSPCHCHSD